MVNTLMLAARFVHAIHWLFLLFVLGGWMLPWKAAWVIHLLTIPLLIVHWRTNENRCILTEMEERLRSTELTSDVAIKVTEAETEEGQFLKSVISRLTGVVPSDEALSKVIYVVMAIVWMLSLLRLVRNFSELQTF